MSIKSFKTFLTEDRWYEDQWIEDNLKQLKKDEGYSEKAYQITIKDPKTGKDKLDKITIGYGANLEDSATQSIMKSIGLNAKDYMSGDKALSQNEAEILLRQQQAQAISDVYAATRKNKNSPLSVLADKDMPDEVRNVTTNLMYQLGRPKFDRFKLFKQNIIDKDFNAAAQELGQGAKPGTESGLMIQTPARTKRHQSMLRSINKPNL
jgi:hypothetical protein